MHLSAGIAGEEIAESLQNAELGIRLLGAEHLQAMLHVSKAQFAARNGDSDGAFKLLKEAQAFSSSLDFEYQGLLERLLADHYVSSGDHANARNHLTRAAKLYSDAGASGAASEILSQLLAVADH